MKTCPICGISFEPTRKNQPTCNEDRCRVEWRLEYGRNYQRKRRAEDRDALNEYNRKWMASNRRKSKGIVEPELSYAERQKANTLAMVGRVEV